MFRHLLGYPKPANYRPPRPAPVPPPKPPKTFQDLPLDVVMCIADHLETKDDIVALACVGWGYLGVALARDRSKKLAMRRGKWRKIRREGVVVMDVDKFGRHDIRSYLYSVVGGPGGA